MAVQSFGSGLKSHVHFHILVTDGLYFPDGSYFALGFWDQPSLLSELRHSILKSLVARNCLQPETAKLLESWPLDRSGFSAFVGEPINQPADRPRLQRVLNYILRPALPLKHLRARKLLTFTTVDAPNAINYVVPLTMELMPANVDCCQLFIQNNGADGVFAGVQSGLDLKAGGCRRCCNTLNHNLVANQRTAAPVHGDV